MSDFETVPVEEMRAMRLRIENDALRIERLLELLSEAYDYRDVFLCPEEVRQKIFDELERPK